ncbi:MAG TPA: tRNA (adenosine(37)-N6)-dimethylallyltransferase MiaA [Phycisphaerales bacterium]|nr:tRNA (adenosine(37)-N6)-dimethylallyltransferase MiaA [Phycisphaerales bacterium]
MAKILILGVTGSGKGAVARALAQRLGGQVLSVDSMKIYRRMDIGTAKPPMEVRRRLVHHLIDVVEPSESFDVEQYLCLARQAMDTMQSAQVPVIAAGGTALYIKALLHGLFDGPGADEDIRCRLKQRLNEMGSAALHAELARVDPAAAQRIHRNDARRIIRALEVYELTGRPISDWQRQWAAPPRSDWTVIGLRRGKDIESRRINRRVERMIELGLRDEAARLLEEEPPLGPQARAAIGYTEMIDHLQGRVTLDEAIERIKINTRKFAKSQRTWFKTFRPVRWIDVPDGMHVEDLAQTVLDRADHK